VCLCSAGQRGDGGLAQSALYAAEDSVATFIDHRSSLHGAHGGMGEHVSVASGGGVGGDGGGGGGWGNRDRTDSYVTLKSPIVCTCSEPLTSNLY